MIHNLYSLVECVVGGAFILGGVSTLTNVDMVKKLIKFFGSKENAVMVHILWWPFVLMGMAVLAVHNDWMLDVSVVVTFVGWAVTIKGIAWLLFPEPMRKLVKYKFWQNHMFLRGYGIISAILGVLILKPYFIL